MTEPQPRIVLACCSDSGYAPYAATMLLSALHRTPRASFVVHYLHDPDFPKAVQKKLQDALAPHAHRLELHFTAIPDDWVEGLPLFSHMPKNLIRPVMWYRVFLPRLLPQEPKVLYIDCDTLVVDSLQPLWETDIGEKALAAVSNPWWPGELSDRWYARCGLQRPEDYFNTGVMLLNLQAFRAHRWDEAVREHGRANAEWTRFGDQDSLVAVLHSERVPLAPRWNVMRIVMMSPDSRRMFTAGELAQMRKRPAIIHFEGSTKPWQDATKHPWGRVHARYARQLPWPVAEAPWQWRDVENFLIRQDWHRLRRLSNRLQAKADALLRRVKPRPLSLTERIARRLKGHAEIRFVQVGSNDGTHGDPISALIKSQSGWRGVFVEPVPAIFRRLKANYGESPRFVFENVLIGREAGVVPFYAVSDQAREALGDALPYWYDQLGSFDRHHITKHLNGKLAPYIEEMQLPAITLPALLRRHGMESLDLLHVDTEGFDDEVLAQLDLDQHRPAVLLYEHKHLSIERRGRAEARLQAAGYQLHRYPDDTLAILPI